MMPASAPRRCAWKFRRCRPPRRCGWRCRPWRQPRRCAWKCRHCRRRPRPARPPCPRCRQWRSRLRAASGAAAAAHAAATRRAAARRRRRPRIGPRRKPTHNRPRNPRPGRRSRPLRRPRPCTRLSPRRNRPPRRCRRLPGRPPRPWRACPMRRCRRDWRCRRGPCPPTRPPACRMRSAPCAARWKAAWTACSGAAARARPRAAARRCSVVCWTRVSAPSWSARWSSACPRGWTPTPRWPGRATNWSAHLPVLGSEDTFLSGGVYALVGPTGVGKTTTLAKLAARCVAREGRDQVAMLTTDNFRIGALEQLQIYGRLMGVPTHSVRDAGELRRLLAELGSRKIVLIDTTGISQRDRHVAEQAAMLCDAGKTVRRLLVLNAASQGDTLDEVAYAYRNGVGEDVAGCIITKLDEARAWARRWTRPSATVCRSITRSARRCPSTWSWRARRVDRPRLRHGARARSTPRARRTWRRVVLGQGNAVDPARRRQVLASAILRPQGGAAAVEAAQNLDDTLNWLDSDLAWPGARVLARVCQRRRGFQPVGPGRRAAGDGAARILRSLRAASAGDARQGRHEGRQPAGRHAAGFHADERSGRRAGCAGAAAGAGPRHAVSFAPGAAADLSRGAGGACWLGGRLGQVPLVHMLEAGTSALWSALTEQGVSWVARSPRPARDQDECPTNLNAVGKSVGYLPVGQPGDMPGLRPVAGGRAAPLALWASGTRSGCRAGRRICDATGVRALDRYGQRRGGGAVLRPDQSAGFAGRCRHGRAVAGAAGRGQGRFPLHGQCLAGLAGRRWRPCAGAPGLDGRPLAAACWQLAHSPAAEVVRGPCRAWRAWIASS